MTASIPLCQFEASCGHALELIQADVIARHYRLTGHAVWFQTGTDENASKNVLAAQARGLSTEELVTRNAATFYCWVQPLKLRGIKDGYTRADERSLPGVLRAHDSDRRRRKAERYPAPMREEFSGTVVTDMGIDKSCFGIAGAIVELDLRLQGPTALTSTRYFLPNRSLTSISTCTSS